MRWVLVVALCACAKERTVDEIDTANLAACERVPRCKNMSVPEGHALCIHDVRVTRLATPAEIAEYEAMVDAGR